MGICTYIDVCTLTFWVNIAQIVSAIGTAATVYVALHLARRSERQRPVLSIRLMPIHSLGPDGTSISYDVVVGVVNAGLLPISISYAQVGLHKSNGKFEWSMGLVAVPSPRKGFIVTNPANMPVKLDHGQEWGERITVTAESQWSRGTKSYGWLSRQRPSFLVRTSLGKVFKARMTRENYRELQQFVRNRPTPQ